MTRPTRFALLAGAVLLLGCYRTTYRNFGVPPVAATATEPAVRVSRWQHFFLFGWIPSERIIRASRVCGGEGRVREIRTRRTFLQGLVTAVSSFYAVNIYSPYTGEVVCEEAPPVAQAAP